MIYPYGIIFEGSFKNDREDCGTTIWPTGKKLTIEEYREIKHFSRGKMTGDRSSNRGIYLMPIVLIPIIK
jgi:hypothetical protein